MKNLSKSLSGFVTAWRRNMYVTGYGGNLAWRLEEDLLVDHPHPDE